MGPASDHCPESKNKKKDVCFKMNFNYLKMNLKVRNELVKRNIMSLDYFNDSVVKFNMRITSICWHQKYPYCFAVGSKHGDISVGSLDRKLDNAEDFGSGWIPSIKQTVKGVSNFK